MKPPGEYLVIGLLSLFHTGFRNSNHNCFNGKPGFNPAFRPNHGPLRTVYSWS